MAKTPANQEEDKENPLPPPSEGNSIAIIAKAIHAVMSEVDYVKKSGENDFHNYTYATEADVLSRIRPAMLRHGLVLVPSVNQVSNIDANGITTISVHYTLVHISGAVWPHPLIAAGAGSDMNKKGVGDKGLYKALTGANKYLLFKLFQIETGDDAEDPKGDYDRDDAAKSGSVDKQARTFYLEGGKIAISRQENTAELKVWWANETDNRKNAGVIKGTDEYSDLYEAFLRKGKELAAKEAR
jgi:hypothetical protein